MRGLTRRDDRIGVDEGSTGTSSQAGVTLENLAERGGIEPRRRKPVPNGVYKTPAPAKARAALQDLESGPPVEL